MKLLLKGCVNKEIKYTNCSGPSVDRAIQKGIFNLKNQILPKVGVFKLTDLHYKEKDKQGLWIKVALNHYQIF